MTDRQPEAPAVPGVAKWQVRGPVLLDAIQWTGENEADVSAFVGTVNASSERVGYRTWDEPGFTIIHSTVDENFIARLWSSALGDWMSVPVGWYVARGVTGLFFAVAADSFAATYEPAETNAAPPAPRSPAASPRDPAPSIVDRAEGISAKAHRPGPKRMVGREAVQHCYGCGARWPCEGSWQLRAEAAETKLAALRDLCSQDRDGVTVRQIRAIIGPEGENRDGA